MSYHPNQQPGYPPQDYQQQGYNQQYQAPLGHSNAYGSGVPPYPQGAHGQFAPQQYSQHAAPHSYGSPGHLPPQNFGGPPPVVQGAYGQQGPQSHHGAYAQAPAQTYDHAANPAMFPPTPASPGYDENVRIHGNAVADATLLRAAMEGKGTRESTLIKILSKPTPVQMKLLRETYDQHHKRDLVKDLESETSGHFRDTLRAIAVGPLMQDVRMLYDAVKGIGTKEEMLNDILLGRSNADMQAIKDKYRAVYKQSLETQVNDDLSGDTAQLFRMVLNNPRTEDSAPLLSKTIEEDVVRLHNATKVHKDKVTVCSILSSRSDGHLRSVAHEFQNRYQLTLHKAIENLTMGHTEKALLLMLGRATDRAMTDAIQLEEAMAGWGTKDVLLLNRVVRIHWDRAHMDQVKRAYKAKYKKELISRVHSETSGDYRKLLEACLE